MTDYRPFIDDPGHLAVLSGDRYVVLRPSGPVASAHGLVRARLKEKLQGQLVSFPACAHVTLAGFSKGTHLGAVQDLVSEWAAVASPVEIEVEKVSSFPSPFRFVIVQVRRTPELFDAFVGLREAARTRGLPPSGEITDDEWVFHMSPGA